MVAIRLQVATKDKPSHDQNLQRGRPSPHAVEGRAADDERAELEVQAPSNFAVVGGGASCAVFIADRRQEDIVARLRRAPPRGGRVGHGAHPGLGARESGHRGQGRSARGCRNFYNGVSCT